jgi:hypothetical protein
MKKINIRKRNGKMNKHISKKNQYNRKLKNRYK